MWICPACQERIEHHPHEEAPRVGVVYRCHVCRLELTPNPDTGRLALPLEAEEPPLSS